MRLLLSSKSRKEMGWLSPGKASQGEKGKLSKVTSNHGASLVDFLGPARHSCQSKHQRACRWGLKGEKEDIFSDVSRSLQLRQPAPPVMPPKSFISMKSWLIRQEQKLTIRMLLCYLSLCLLRRQAVGLSVNAIIYVIAHLFFIGQTTLKGEKIILS